MVCKKGTIYFLQSVDASLTRRWRKWLNPKSSGCGKTTLLNLILGIVDADGGAILYNRKDLTHGHGKTRV